MRKEIRISGFGGQGVVLSGVILGRAAVLYDKKKATQTQSYGSEARGGAARSEVIISDESIDYPKVVSPDILIAMSQQAMDKYIKDLKSEGILIVDSDLVKDLPETTTFSLYRVPASQIASKEFSRIIVANMIMVGFLVSLTEVVSLEALKNSVRASVPKGTEELNLKAIERGRKIVNGLDDVKQLESPSNEYKLK